MTQLVTCLLCSHQISSDAAFCPSCGKRDAGAEAYREHVRDTVPAVGTIFSGHVTQVKEFGVFVTVPGGAEGLVHISELSHQRVRRVSDVTRVGASIRVKLIAIDARGRIKLSARI